MNTQLKWWVVAGAAVWLVSASSALADQPVDRTATCQPNGTVKVQNVAGEVVVEAWDRSEVHVTGSLGEKVQELRIDEDGEDVDIEVILPRKVQGRGGEAKLKIRVPRRADVEVETVSAPIRVDGANGDLELETVSGTITVQSDARSAEIATVSGAIDVRGNLGSVEAESVSGVIELRETSGDAEASTTSGDIRILGGDFAKASCASVSGTILFEGRPIGNGEFEFENFSGSITLKLPGDVNADFQVETFNGDIDSDFGGKVLKEEYGPGASMNVIYGTGAAEFSVSTFSGSIQLQKK